MVDEIDPGQNFTSKFTCFDGRIKRQSSLLNNVWQKNEIEIRNSCF
jgi:hypothetical protein